MHVLRWFVAGSLVIAISGVWGATLPPVNAATGGNGLPAPVTLNGVGGVVVGMTGQQMRRIWGIPMPVIEDGLVDRSYGGICAGKMHGAAFFVLGDLKTLVFFKGAVTDRGVGVGSSLRQLRAAYGKRLRPVVLSDSSTRAWRVVEPGPPPTLALQFHLYNTGRVDALLYGTVDGVRFGTDLRPLSIANVTC
jgi:hypothetical protein